ncbi:MAG: hypothetical protein HYS04_07340 [Acidobacteria bacterium]|nr:hypothetical protein [Acidobacteriota bacterium]
MPGGEDSGFGGGENVDFPTELKKWADAIKATAEAIDAMARTIDNSATRSVILEIDNTTGRTLALHDRDHVHGGFRTVPPFEIPPRKPGLFTSQNSSPLVGTQGWVKYRIGVDGTIFHVEWDNPLVGGNECLCRVEGPNADFFGGIAISGGGNTGVQMHFLLGEKANAAPRQSDWRTCEKCKTLFYSLEEGNCGAQALGIDSAPSGDLRSGIQAPQGPLPAGLQGSPSGRSRRAAQGQFDQRPVGTGRPLFGKHVAAGYTFRLPHSVAGLNRQEGWRKCIHCKGLFYDGSDSKGVCPGRGGHAADAAGFNFRLPAGMPAGVSQQDNWRFCDKCFSMFYLPQNAAGICAAGGDHHAASESYVLDHS